jgi:hypothetical protein
MIASTAGTPGESLTGANALFRESEFSFRTGKPS